MARKKYLNLSYDGDPASPGQVTMSEDAVDLLVNAGAGWRELVFTATSSTAAAIIPVDANGATLNLEDGDHMAIFADILAAQADGSMGYWSRRGAIKREGETTSLSGSIQTIGTDIADTNIGSPTIAMTADDDNDRLICTVTPANATETEWKIVLSYFLNNF